MRATAEIVSQKYCPADDELFKVVFTLRIKFDNRSDRTLILDKQIGKFAAVEIVAKSRERLALKDYESIPNFDGIEEQDPPHFKPSLALLHSNFVLLAPGQSLESGTSLEEFVWYKSKLPGKSAINYGDHVLQMGFVSSKYTAKAPQFAESWGKYGQLVTDIVYSEPVDFQIPKNAAIQKTCD